MKRFLRIICAIFLMILWGTVFFSRANAAELDCRFESDFARLDAIKTNPSLDYLAGIRAELSIRKEILRKIIACGHHEIDLLQTRVSNVPATNDSIKNLQHNFLEALDRANQYYDDQEGRIDTLGINGSRDIAKSMRDWRFHNYDPLAAEAYNFILWAKNQELFQTAKNRFADIQKTVSSLKFAEADEIQKLFDDAKHNLNSAETLNTNVQESLDIFASADDVFQTLKQSLEALSKTYQNIFDISQTVQKILPR